MNKQILKTNLNNLIGEDLSEGILMSAVFDAIDEPRECHDLNLKFESYMIPGRNGEMRRHFFVYEDIPINQSQKLLITGCTNMADVITEINLFEKDSKIPITDVLTECSMMVGDMMDMQGFQAKINQIFLKTALMPEDQIQTRMGFPPDQYNAHERMATWTYQIAPNSAVLMFDLEIIPNPDLPKHPEPDMIFKIISFGFRKFRPADALGLG